MTNGGICTSKQEIVKLLTTIQAAFPNFSVANKEITLKIWHEMLSDYTYEHIAVALKAYISTDTSGFAPSIGELIQKANSLVENGELNEIEAWTLVSKAIRNGYYGAEKEFEKLPPIVQKSVGSPEQLRMWATTDSKSIETVISSNFMRTYKAEVKRAKEYERLPEDVKAIMQKISPLNRIKENEQACVD